MGSGALESETAIIQSELELMIGAAKLEGIGEVPLGLPILRVDSRIQFADAIDQEAIERGAGSVGAKQGSVGIASDGLAAGCLPDGIAGGGYWD